MGQKKMQYKNKNRQAGRKQKPAAVNEIAVYLACNIVFILFITTPVAGISLLGLFQLGLMESYNRISGFMGVAIFLTTLSIFLIYLLWDFLRLRAWTYRYVEFILSWSILVAVLGLKKKLQQEDVRRAFGLTDKPDPNEGNW
jgi:hypothetical protein